MATHYEVLGVPLNARVDDIRNAYLAKVHQLGSDRFLSAPAEVRQAVTESLSLVEEAWRVLGDARLRSEYDCSLDSSIGNSPTKGSARRTHEPPPGAGGLGDAQMEPSVELFGVLPLYNLKWEGRALAEWLSPHHHVTAHDVCWMKASAAYFAVAAADLHINVVHLTANPAPVDGTVVDQEPSAGSSVRRFGVVTVQVWHPSVDNETASA